MTDIEDHPLRPRPEPLRRALDGQLYPLSRFLHWYGSIEGQWHWLAAYVDHDPQYQWSSTDLSANCPTDHSGLRVALDRQWYNYDQFIQFHGFYVGNRHWYAAGRYWQRQHMAASCGSNTISDDAISMVVNTRRVAIREEATELRAESAALEAPQVTRYINDIVPAAATSVQHNQSPGRLSDWARHHWEYIARCKGCARDLTRVFILQECVSCKVKVCPNCIVREGGSTWCTVCYDLGEQ